MNYLTSRALNQFNYWVSRTFSHFELPNGVLREDDVVEVIDKREDFVHQNLENLDSEILKKTVEIGHKLYPNASLIKTYASTLNNLPNKDFTPYPYYDTTEVIFGFEKNDQFVQEKSRSNMQYLGTCTLRKTNDKIEQYNHLNCRVCDQVTELFKKSGHHFLFFTVYGPRDNAGEMLRAYDHLKI